jgi:hypothetical protein
MINTNRLSFFNMANPHCLIIKLIHSGSKPLSRSSKPVTAQRAVVKKNQSLETEGPG